MSTHCILIMRIQDVVYLFCLFNVIHIIVGSKCNSILLTECSRCFGCVQTIKIMKAGGPLGLNIVGGADLVCHPFGIDKPGTFVSKVCTHSKHCVIIVNNDVIVEFVILNLSRFVWKLVLLINVESHLL